MNNVPNPKRQRQKELRRLKLEQERKAALAKKRRTAGILGVLAAIVVAGVLYLTDSRGDEEPTPEASATPAASVSPADPSAPKPVAVMTTSEGTLEIELATDTSPNVAAAFQAMAKEGFYDGLTFHRIVKDFAIQGGDPSGNGTGGPDTKTVDPVPADFRYVRGTVAMAKSQNEESGTAGSQFFIVPSDSAADRLTPDYAILGKVTSGLETVDKLNAVETTGPAGGGEQSTPVNPVTIEKVEIKEP